MTNSALSAAGDKPAAGQSLLALLFSAFFFMQSCKCMPFCFKSAMKEITCICNSKLPVQSSLMSFRVWLISGCAVVRDLATGQLHCLAARWSMEEHIAQSYVSGLPSRRRGTARHDNTVSEAARGHFDIDDQAATPFAA